MTDRPTPPGMMLDSLGGQLLASANGLTVSAPPERIVFTGVNPSAPGESAPPTRGQGWPQGIHRKIGYVP